MARKKSRVVIEIDPLKISEEQLNQKATDETSLREFSNAVKKHEKLSNALKKKK